MKKLSILSNASRSKRSLSLAVINLAVSEYVLYDKLSWTNTNVLVNLAGVREREGEWDRMINEKERKKISLTELMINFLNAYFEFKSLFKKMKGILFQLIDSRPYL